MALSAETANKLRAAVGTLQEAERELMLPGAGPEEVGYYLDARADRDAAVEAAIAER